MPLPGCLGATHAWRRDIAVVCTLCRQRTTEHNRSKSLSRLQQRRHKRSMLPLGLCSAKQAKADKGNDRARRVASHVLWACEAKMNTGEIMTGASRHLSFFRRQRLSKHEPQVDVSTPNNIFIIYSPPCGRVKVKSPLTERTRASLSAPIIETLKIWLAHELRVRTERVESASDLLRMSLDA